MTAPAPTTDLQRRFLAIAAPILERGGTWREVAEAVGMTEGNTWKMGRRLGLQTLNRQGRPRGPLKPEHRAKVMAALELARRVPDPRKLPPMSAAQRRLYDKMRECGLTRQAALEGALGA